MPDNSSKEETDIIEYPTTVYDGALLPLMKKTHHHYEDRILVGPHNYSTTIGFLVWQKKYAHFETKFSDVWVVSLAKAGTTWTQELTWCVLFGLDSPRKDELLMKRFPFFEWDSLIYEAEDSMTEIAADDDPCAAGETWKILHSMAEPRTIKSHLSLQLLPAHLWKSKAKIIYVCRDPRDVCVSYYYHYIKLDGFIGTLDEFVELFLADLLLFLPYWQHLLDFWKIRDRENVLFIRYEELQENLGEMIGRVSEFLGKKTSVEEIMKYTEHLSFDSMKKNKSTNNESIRAIDTEQAKGIKFMRKGKVGDWRNHFDEKTTNRFQLWTESHLKNSDFPFYRDY